MATHKEIQAYVKEHYGFVPKTCWIAHVKEMSELKVRRARNRVGEARKYPCRPSRIEPIRAALLHYRIIKEPGAVGV